MKISFPANAGVFIVHQLCSLMHVVLPKSCLSTVSFVLVLAKFNLPGSASLSLKDSSNVEVDSDIFDELLKSSAVSFKAEECDGEALRAYIFNVFFKNLFSTSANFDTQF